MLHQVFVSYSKKDKAVADAVYNALERAGVECWIASQNIEGGEQWTDAIIRGISECKVMVLIFSVNANMSKHVNREVQHACENNVIVIPFRVQDVEPTPNLKYYTSSVQYIDATVPPFEQHLHKLIDRVQHILSAEGAPPRPAPHGEQAPRPAHPQGGEGFQRPAYPYVNYGPQSPLPTPQSPQVSSSTPMLIMILGILSIFCFGIITGPIAIFMGNKEKRAIKAGLKPASGLSSVQIGIVCGWIGLVFSILMFFFYMLAALSRQTSYPY